MKTDLLRAIEIHTSGKYNCVIVRENEIHVFNEKGIKALMKVLHENPEWLHDSSVADSVVGKAAAVLMCVGGVKNVYATMISHSGKEVLRSNGIPFSYGMEVDYIMNQSGDNYCPMELLCEGIRSVTECYEQLSRALIRVKPQRE